MSGFWIPAIMIVLSGGNPVLIYDAGAAFDTEEICESYADVILHEIPEQEFEDAEKVVYSCLFIPDTRGA